MPKILDDYTTASSSIIVVDQTDGRVLLSENASAKLPVASLTKIMTTYLAITHASDLKQKVTITKDMTAVDPEFVIAGLNPGNVVTLEELLYLTMLPSTADAAQALAIATSGSLEKFITDMNAQASAWGLTNTHFNNAVGYDENNYSTASDIALMLQKALENPTFKQVFETTEYKLTSLNLTAEKTLSHIPLDTSAITGAKTGFTDAAGRCLASISDHLLIVTLGSKSDTGHVADTLHIYNYFAENYGYDAISTPDRLVTTLPVASATESEFEIHEPTDSISYYLPKNHAEIISEFTPTISEITKDTPLDSELGQITYTLDGKILYSAPVYLTKEFTFINYPLLIAIAVAALLLIAIIISRIKRHLKSRPKRTLPVRFS